MKICKVIMPAILLLMILLPASAFSAGFSWIGLGWNFGASTSTYTVPAIPGVIQSSTTEFPAGYGGTELTLAFYGSHFYTRVELGGLVDVVASMLVSNSASASSPFNYMDCYLAGAKVGGEFIQFGDAGGIGAGATFGWRVFGANAVPNALKHNDGTTEALVPKGTGVLELGPHLEASISMAQFLQVLSTFSLDFWLMKDGFGSAGFSWTTYITAKLGPVALILKPNYQFKNINTYEFAYGTSSVGNMKVSTGTWSIGLILAANFE